MVDFTDRMEHLTDFVVKQNPSLKNVLRRIEIRRPRWVSLIFLFIVICAVIFRLLAYGDPFLSVGTNDTGSYIPKSSVFSWEFFTAKRPPTIPLLYKIFEPPGGLKLTNISQPSIETPKTPVLQPGFDGVVFSQMIIAIISWVMLAWVIYRRFKNPFIRLFAAAFILIFGFSPNLAEWDRILMSESLTFSFITLLMALTIEILHRWFVDGLAKSWVTKILLSLWVIIMILWGFTRDTNMYFVFLANLFLLMALLLAVFIKKARNYLPIWQIVPVVLVLTGVIILQQVSLKQSTRWAQVLVANIRGNIMPYTTRVQFLVDHGMPYSEQIHKVLRQSVRGRFYEQVPELWTWLKENGTWTYTLFLINTPLWATLDLFNNLDELALTNHQVYYPASSSLTPVWFRPAGDFLHPKSKVILFIDLLCLLMMIYTGVRNREAGQVSWAIILSWLMISLVFLLFISYHGDYYSKSRHGLVALESFRLLQWLMIFILFDYGQGEWKFRPSNQAINNRSENKAGHQQLSGDHLDSY